MLTGYDFASTHASHHATLEDAMTHAFELTRLSGLDWQSWPETDAT